MMKKQKRKILPIVKKMNFAEAEEATVEYYANVDWKESADAVETMRKGIWNEEYKGEWKK